MLDVLAAVGNVEGVSICPLRSQGFGGDTGIEYFSGRPLKVRASHVSRKNKNHEISPTFFTRSTRQVLRYNSNFCQNFTDLNMKHCTNSSLQQMGILSHPY